MAPFIVTIRGSPAVASRSYRVDAAIEVERLLGKLIQDGRGEATLEPFGPGGSRLSISLTEGRAAARIMFFEANRPPRWAQMPHETAVEIAAHFYRTARLLDTVRWQDGPPDDLPEKHEERDEE